MERIEHQAFTSQELRGALGTFATGVTVVTTAGEGHAYGMTANAFSAVSLDPPLVLVCTITVSEATGHIGRNGVFAVNILSATQEPLSRYFSSRDRPRGRDAFARVDHRTVASGSPILDGAAGFLDCALHSRSDAGDHTIFIGEVLAIGCEQDLAPLLFHGGRYREVKP
jgi:flavin reductase